MGHLTPDALRALAETAAKHPRWSWVSLEGPTTEADRLIALAPALARLCAELGEALDRIWQRRESWYDAMHDDEAGLPSDEAEAAWEIASAALARLAELEAPK